MTRKFHDYDMMFHDFITIGGKRHPITEGYKLTNLAPGSYCYVVKLAGDDCGEYRWMRKTANGMPGHFYTQLGSIRYTFYKSEADALLAGQQWAWRKDREAARAA